MKRLLLLLCVSYTAFGQISIIPQPAVSQLQRGEFVIRPGLRVWASPSCSSERRFLETYWQHAGLPTLINAPKARRADVVLLVDPTRGEALGSEGYELIISPRRISVSGASATGVFYGLQTLRHVMAGIEKNASAGGLRMAALLVRDKPRFGLRSFRLDDEGNGIGAVAIKKLLDELALLKFNRFHWHLNDSSSRDQLRDIEHYAEERHIRLEWEVGMPGMSNTQPTPSRPITYIRKGDPKEILDAANLGLHLVISTVSETILSKPLAELSLDRVYRFEPIPEQLPEDLRPQILGVGYEHRSEQTSSPTRLFSQLHPRLAAAAEVAWTFAQHKDLARFKAGLDRLYSQTMPTMGSIR